MDWFKQVSGRVVQFDMNLGEDISSFSQAKWLVIAKRGEQPLKTQKKKDASFHI